jgi:1,5-anhydro-D-fructose reductase (1,5-anhydro-D-mannitol-forming)
VPAHLQGWRFKDPRTSAGAILDLTVHDADTLRWVLGAEPVEAMAYAQHAGMASGENEVGAMSLLRLDSGVVAQVFSCARTIAAFERAVRGEGHPTSTGEDGTRSLAAALAALESARTGRRVAIRFD